MVRAVPKSRKKDVGNGNHNPMETDSF